MPQAVTHILVPILLVAIFRDFYLKKKSKRHFPLHYVFLAGIGGILLDIDIIFFWLKQKSRLPFIPDSYQSSSIFFQHSF